MLRSKVKPFIMQTPNRSKKPTNAISSQSLVWMKMKKKEKKNMLNKSYCVSVYFFFGKAKKILLNRTLYYLFLLYCVTLCSINALFYVALLCMLVFRIVEEEDASSFSTIVIIVPILFRLVYPNNEFGNVKQCVQRLKIFLILNWIRSGCVLYWIRYSCEWKKTKKFNNIVCSSKIGCSDTETKKQGNSYTFCTYYINH